MKKILSLFALVLLIGCSSDREALSDENFITSFSLSLNGSIENGEINQSTGEIIFDSTVGANLENLIPTITYSENAQISPNENNPQDFNDTVSYTVTAENGNTKSYIITIENRPYGTGKQILAYSFEVEGQIFSCDIDEQQKKITLDVVDLDLSAIVPNIIISEFATISPSPSSPQNLDNVVEYDVTAENGSTVTYEVDINNRPISTERKILSFSLENSGQTYQGVIDQDDKTIFINFGSIDISALSPTILISDYATISPESSTAQDFNNPVEYLVTAESGDTSIYTVHANKPTILTVGPSFSGSLIFYAGAELIINGDYIDPEEIGAQISLSDGVNDYPLTVTSFTSGLNTISNTISYRIFAIIPYGLSTNSNYILKYSSETDDTSLETSLDIMSGGPIQMSFDQQSYSFNDVLIMNGMNLISGLVVPSNGNYFIIEYSDNYDIQVNNERTELTWTLDYYSLFPSYYGDNPEVKKLYTMDEDRRLGAPINIIFN